MRPYPWVQQMAGTACDQDIYGHRMAGSATAGMRCTNSCDLSVTAPPNHRPLPIATPLRYTGSVPDEEATQRFNVELPLDLHAQLQQRAKDEERSMSAVIRIAVKRYLKETTS